MPAEPELPQAMHLGQPNLNTPAVPSEAMNTAVTTWLMTPGVPDQPLVLEDFLNRPVWHRKAACRGMGPALFFPGLGESTAPAKAVCAGCEVRSECLDAVVSDQRAPGIWGGLSERQRTQLRRGAA
jgi:WhiB family transcriptional regulator, redox-sensing transcriptional regulator